MRLVNPTVHFRDRTYRYSGWIFVWWLWLWKDVILMLILSLGVAMYIEFKLALVGIYFSNIYISVSKMLLPVEPLRCC
jgi:hypothetical protein